MSGEFSVPGDGVPWTADRSRADCTVYLGQGGETPGELGGEGEREIVVAESESEPTDAFLREVYTDRLRGRCAAVLLVVLYGDGYAATCGPGGRGGPGDSDPVIVRGVSAERVRRVCAAALATPAGHTALGSLVETLLQPSEALSGLTTRGLLSMRELTVGVPARADWAEASERARNALSDDPRELFRGLNYDVERIAARRYVLKHATDGREAAVAVFAQTAESVESEHDHDQSRFVDDSSVEDALREAEARDLEYVVGCAGDRLRLYPTDPAAGVDARGGSDTYVEVTTSLLDGDRAAYLWLLFSSEALREGGSLHQIVEASSAAVTGVAERLRERIYDDVVPHLAEALVRARGLEDPTADDLEETYRMTLVLLYRLLFVAYAEDRGFLPRHRNERYDACSMGGIARAIQDRSEFDDDSTVLWDTVTTLTRAVHDGSERMGLPAYGGRLFSADDGRNRAGYALSQVELTDAAFGPALEALLVDETPDGWDGPVDFRDVGVREFGLVYEGLLESELSVANRALTTEGTGPAGRYVPAGDADEIAITEGQVYLHGHSGERKATGTFYTRRRFVEHLLEYSLEPALDTHLKRVKTLRETQGDEAATAAFFDFRVADIAMGSGHFLVSAVDRIERAFRRYLQESPLGGVENELDRLSDAAEAALGREETALEVRRRHLLRRQIARRCLYGVDLNELATEIARLSLWAHTFVPGRPLNCFAYNLRTGDSLAGVGTLDEVAALLDETRVLCPHSSDTGDRSVMDGIRDDLAELGAFVDTAAAQARDAHSIRREVEERLESVRVRFDILSASRLDDDVDATAAVETTVDRLTPSSAERAAAVLSSTDPLHFPVAFPEVFTADGGFDVVVGNPPWEETVLEEDEFWTRYVPGFQGLAQGEQERRASELREERSDLVEKYERERAVLERRRDVLANGPYPGMATGDPDTYKAFCWRFWRLSRRGGRLGVVLPRSALVAAGSEPFRRTLLSEGVVADVTLLKNRAGWVFDAIAEQYTVALVAVERVTPGRSDTLPLRGPFPDLETYEVGLRNEPCRFGLEQARNWTRTASFPALPADPRAVAVFERVSEHPPLGLDDTDSWRARPNTELHATADKVTRDGTRVMEFAADPPRGFWPVYNGASFSHWTPDTGERYAWTDPGVVLDYLQRRRQNSARYAGSRSAFYEMPEEWLDDPETLPCLSTRVVFRDIARSTDRRTIIPALVPPRTVLTNKAPYFLWPRGDERDEAYLLGVMSSLPFDWYARRFIELGVNYHLLNAIPVPRPGRESELRRRVVGLAGRLAAVDARYADWAERVGVGYGPLDPERRRVAVDELDAVVAHLYGLTREQLRVTFETFHEGPEHRRRLEGVLEYYTDWEDRLDGQNRIDGRRTTRLSKGSALRTASGR